MSASTWSSVTWDVARAGGLMAYVLLTLSVALGLALSVRWQRPRWPRLITNDLHNFVAGLTLVFMALHGVGLLLDPFMRFGWAEVLIPLTSHYRALWLAPGIVAFYLAVAVWISAYLRPRLGYALWRRLHAATFAVYALATVHGLATGTDTHAPWALGLYAASLLLVGALLCYRLLIPIGTRGRAYPNLAGVVALLLIGVGVWTVTGPARPGWNAAANNGQGNGARGPSALTPGGTTATVDAFARPFAVSYQGALAQGVPDATGAVTLGVEAPLTGGPAGRVHLTLQGTVTATGDVAVAGGQVTLTGPGVGGAPRYQGALQGIGNDGAGLQWQAALVEPSGRTLAVSGTLQVAADGQATGMVRSSPATR
ncbi:MAG: ferric reductase-like transmembrane domain-containing protein [Chloroflexota bacterium]|nr:ferric reductase-like transmembrane domain-containing protein [Chloroflexota bacterium]